MRGRAAALLICTSMLNTAMAQAPEDRGEQEALRHFLEHSLSRAEGFTDRFAAEVWLVDMNARLATFVSDPEARMELLQQVHSAAFAADLAPELVLAVIEVESHFDRFAVSRAGAQGLMQVMPFWKEQLGRSDDNLTHNPTNLRYGCTILKFYLQRESGDLHLALAAYNGSTGSRRYSDRVRRAWQQHWRTTALDWSR